MPYLLLFLFFLFQNPISESHDLSITIENIKSVEGTIEIGIYDNGDRFLEKGYAVRNASVNVRAQSETVIIKDLPKGSYAISLYHDKNSNGQCDRNFLGIPKEPYGFSNNFKPKFSAPKFLDCAFNLTSDHSLTITLIN